MTIRFQCQCGKDIHAPDKLAGKKAKCPKCGVVLTVPAPRRPPPPTAASAPAVDEEEDATPYGLEGGKLLESGSSGMVARVRVSKDEKLACCLTIADKEPLALVGVGDDIAILDLESNTRSGKLVGHEATVTCAAITPDGALAVSGDEDGEVLVWDIANRAVRDRYQPHKGKVNGVAVSSGGKYMVTGGDDGRVLLWRTSNGKCRDLQKSQWKSPVSCVAFSPDGRFIMAGGDKIVAWDFESGEVTRRLKGLEGGVTAVTFTHDDEYIVAASADAVQACRWLRDKPTEEPELTLTVNDSEHRTDVYLSVLALGGTHLVTISDFFILHEAAASPQLGSVSGGIAGMAVGGMLGVGAGLGRAFVDAAIAGMGDGPTTTEFRALELWQFGREEPVVTYRLPSSIESPCTICASAIQNRILLGTGDGVVRVYAFL